MPETITGFDFAETAKILAEVAGKTPSPKALQEFAEALRSLTKADAVLLVDPVSKNLLANASPSAEIAQNLVSSAASTLAKAAADAPVSQKFNFRNRAVHLHAIPCQPAGAAAWLMVWARGETGDLDLRFAIAQMALSYLPGSQKKGPAPIFELLGSITHENQSGFVEALARILDCSQVLLARKSWKGLKLTASSTNLPDPRSPLHHTLVLVAKSIEGEPVCYPEQDPADGALAEVARLYECDSLAVIPSDDWLLFAGWSEGAGPYKRGLDLAQIQEFTTPLFPLLSQRQRAGRRLGHFWSQQPVARRAILLTALVAAVVLMAFPFPLRIHSSATLEPTLHRFVAAPFDAILKKVHVGTGDMVKAGQLLAELDDREIKERTAELQAQAASANLQGASDLAEANFNQSAVSSLQAERVQHELEVLRYRQGNLQVLSPISGMVIEGDLERSEGAALSLGRPIMEVAPLDKMVIEAALREDDVAYARPGQNITVRLHAFPGETFQSKITRIQPRAETRDGRNVFVAEAEIGNPDSRLRPGMKGEAVILAEPAPLIWILFRKPWNTVRGWLFW